MTDRTVTVAEAEVRWSWHTAACLRNCTVTRTDGVWSLSGSIVTCNARRLSQQPLTFVVPVQGGTWRWPVESLQIADAVLMARLGPKELSDSAKESLHLS